VTEFSVIIPARNEAAMIGAALRSVAEQACADGAVEAIVVANGCDDQTAAVARSMAAELDLKTQVIEMAQGGLARAKNVGARAAGGRWLVFLDADSRFGPGLLDCVRRRTGSGEEAGSIPVYADGGDLVDRAFFGLIEFGKALFGIQAQMFYCPREAFLLVGGFDESLNLAEDRDLIRRLQARGLKFGRVKSAAIFTSPRRLHRLPMHLNVPLTFARWALANWGIGRRWPY
jgi:glycosyltransferase involved in cell wall biosynthesis